MLRGYQVPGQLGCRGGSSVRSETTSRASAGGRARSGASPLRTPGNRSRLILWRSRRRLGDACVRHVPGAQVRLACGWAPRITRAEVAATNRRARFPAAQRHGVLRIAPAPDLAGPPAYRVGESGVRAARLVLAPADVAWKSYGLRIVFCDPRWVPCAQRGSHAAPALYSFASHASPRRGERDAHRRCAGGTAAERARSAARMGTRDHGPALRDPQSAAPLHARQLPPECAAPKMTNVVLIGRCT